MEHFSLDQTIFDLSTTTETRTWNVRHAVEGTLIFGGIGSGKTSGSGRTLALKYLSAGFGGLVLTVKPDEKAEWQKYCEITGRSDDLIILEPKGKYNFNFLEYESAHAAGESAITDNIVEVLKTVINAGEEKGGRGDDAFWESARDMLMFNVIDLCKLANGKLSLDQMYSIAQTIPKADEKLKKPEEAKDFQKAMARARKKVRALVDAWRETLSEVEIELCQDNDYESERVEEEIPEAKLFRSFDGFFFDNYNNLHEKTRSIIDFSLSGFLFRLLREPVYSMFCKGTSNIRPEDSLDGKIILIDLPVKLFHKVGRDCQILFKYIWQRSMEKRDTNVNGRPVFLWADEAQNFLHEHDASFQATARSSRVATVYITQNLPNLYAAMGGQRSEHRVKSFMGTLASKIFHANADIETNKYASELIGDATFTNPTKSMSMSDKFTMSESVSLQLQRRVRPEKFVGLKSGGRNNNHDVEGYLHHQGDPVHGDLNHLLMIFNQNFKPKPQIT